MNAKKKYLSIEEAANDLGIAPGELNRMRERGEVRGFTDRGTWKFLADDVEKLRRSRQVDSDPEVPIFFGLDDDDATITPGDEKGSDSDVRLMVDHPGPARGGLSDSDSDVRLAASKPGKPIDPLAGTDSDVRLFGNLPGKGKSLDLDGSDSDVKLVGSPSSKKKGSSDSSVLLHSGEKKSLSGSDSDVRLVAPLGSGKSASPDLHDDEPIGLMGGATDSDIRLFGGGPVAKAGSPNVHGDSAMRGGSDSDSDVRLLAPKKSKGKAAPAPLDIPDVPLRDLDAPPRASNPSAFADLQESDDDITLAMPVNEVSPPSKSKPAPAAEKQSFFDDEDDIALAPLADDDDRIDLSPTKAASSLDDSGISLAALDDEASESGISLDLGDGDSGISLADEADDSGISLGDESSSKSRSKLGVGRPDDSGIALDRPFKQPKSAKSQRKVAADDDLDTTAPMAPLLAGDDDLLDTQMEVPLLGADDDDSEFTQGDDASTNVILLDDDDETAETDMLSGSGKRGAVVDDVEEVADMDSSEMILDDSGELADISDEVTGEDDELDEMDVFEGGDDDAVGEEGETDDDDLAPLPSRAIAAPVEHEWSGIDFALVAFSGLLTVGGAALGFDLMRNLWHTDLANVNPVSSMLLDLFRGMFS